MSHNLRTKRALILADYFLECQSQGVLSDDIDYMDAMIVITADIDFIKEDLKIDV